VHKVSERQSCGIYSSESPACFQVEFQPQTPQAARERKPWRYIGKKQANRSAGPTKNFATSGWGHRGPRSPAGTSKKADFISRCRHPATFRWERMRRFEILRSRQIARTPSCGSRAAPSRKKNGSFPDFSFRVEGKVLAKTKKKPFVRAQLVWKNVVFFEAIPLHVFLLMESRGYMVFESPCARVPE